MRAKCVLLCMVVRYGTWCLAQDLQDEFYVTTGIPGSEGTENPPEDVPPYRGHRPSWNFTEMPGPIDRPIQHARVARNLTVHPLPLPDSNHELMFNVTWLTPLGPPVLDYSLEIRSMTETIDCKSSMCYEYNIPGDVTWWVMPSFTHSVAGTCAVRPGCSYHVRLIAHPWDGHTSANFQVSLDECVADVCSCAHASQLPVPEVSASTTTVDGAQFANVSWSLPPPVHRVRLPKGLNKQYYFVSLGKQMVSNAHPSPWYAQIASRKVDTNGPVAAGDSKVRWVLLPIDERSGGRSGPPRGERPRKFDERRPMLVVIDVKLLARVSVIDDRGCFGPAGNSTAYDPSEAVQFPLKTFAIWATIGGICVLAMIGLLALSAGAVKRVLRALRPAPASSPAALKPLRRRPAWFPLQIHNNNDSTSPRAQVEQSPLYAHKELDVEEHQGDHWEVKRTRVHLGALIGSGAFGRVHAAHLDMPGGETIVVAAKMLAENASGDEIQDFLSEIQMQKHVGYHKHVIRLIGCCTLQTPLIALLECAPRGDLLTLLRAARARRHRPRPQAKQDSDVNGRPSVTDTEYTNLSDSDPPLSEDKFLNDDETYTRDHYVAEPALHLDSDTMREYALQVALGMRHLEGRGITHRDLAARNILMDGAGVLKVADFGLSRSGVYVHTRSRPVPLRWLAPEAIVHSQYCSASDVWAFGVLLWEIATLGGFPYVELSNHQVPPFLSGGGRLPRPARASPSLYQLMTECWSEDLRDRPTFAEIVDKLTAQKQLYVDLDCVFPPLEDDLTEYNFSMSTDGDR